MLYNCRFDRFNYNYLLVGHLQKSLACLAYIHCIWDVVLFRRKSCIGALCGCSLCIWDGGIITIRRLYYTPALSFNYSYSYHPITSHLLYHLVDTNIHILTFFFLVLVFNNNSSNDNRSNK